MTWFQWTLPILAATLISSPASGQLIPPSEVPPEGGRQTKLTAKDNDGTVVVRGDRFLVTLPHRARFQWKPMLKDSAAPKELEDLRKFESTGNSGQNSVGMAEMQISTFDLPAKKDGAIKLELIYTDLRDPSKAPKDGELYKPTGEDLSQECNQPRPNMRYVVSLKRG